MMDIAGDNEGNVLSLDDDATVHIKKIGEELAHHLALAEDAAMITLNRLKSLKKPLRIDEPQGLVSLLFAESSKTHSMNT